MKVCGLILAAGESSRLGRPKQLVKDGDKTLLELAIESALNAPLDTVFVVLGARHEQIKSAIAHLPVALIYNKQWKEGIGSSIRAGIEAVMAEGKYEGVLMMVCDQLHVKTPHLQALIQAYRNKKNPIIATAYGEQIGVPAIFDKKHFTFLRELEGDAGAKKLIRQFPDEVYAIEFEPASIDVDTPEDLKRSGLA